MMEYYRKELKLDADHIKAWRTTLAWIFDIIGGALHELRDEHVGAQEIVKVRIMHAKKLHNITGLS